MQSKNRRFLLLLALLFIVGEVIFGFVSYRKSIAYAQVQNERHLHEILMRQRALHKYVEETLKPVIYELKAEGKLYDEFFDPRILSFTYIARNINDNLNTLLDKERELRIFHEGALQYKLATDNPRNELNRATPKELTILERFRSGELKKYSETIKEEGHNYIYHAIPVAPNKESCMRCHSTPDKAPAEMIAQYGAEKGFGEEVGRIRAMISLKVPFDHELREAMWLFQFTMIAMGLFLLLLYGVIFFFIRRIDAQQQIIHSYNQVLKEEAEHDGLTGLYNRRSFENALNRLVENEPFVLSIFDLDHFKNFNDTYGHQMGDEILQALSHLVRQNIREDDRLYRIGGEEFAIISVRQDIEGVVKLFERLFEALAAHDFGNDIRVHISAGIAASRPGENRDAIYRRADAALYEAKAGGRARFVVAD